MKSIIFILFLVFPAFSFAEIRDANTEKEKWYLALGSKVEKEIIKKIEDPINSFFNEPVYQAVIGSIEDLFGKKFSESLSGLISIGPFLKMDSFIGSFGRSEAQVMTGVILRAIHEAKEEIIMAVEQQYRDETTARLNALISNYQVYNARSEADRQLLFFELGGFLSEATYIRERIAVKPINYINDLHPYLTVSSLQVMMEREYTRWVSVNNDPDIDEADIEQEIQSVLAVLVSQINSFYVQTSIGTLSYWQNSFASEFDTGNGSYVGAIDEVNINTQKYEVVGSQRYAYKMGGENVEFSMYLLKDDCYASHFDSGVYNIVRHYDVYDAAGNFYKKISQEGGTIDRRDFNCGFENPAQIKIVNKNGAVTGLRLRGAVFELRDRHKNNVEAFNAYLVDGYLPIKRALDGWWSLARTTTRVMSEVDLYIATNIEPRHDLSVSVVSSEDIIGLGKLNVYRVNNSGGGAADSVTLQVRLLSPGFAMTLLGIVDENGNAYPSYNCDGGKCTTANMLPGGAMEMAVLIYDGAVVSELDLVVEAFSSGIEITSRNNQINEKVVF